MKFLLFVICLAATNVFSSPTPQNILDADELNFQFFDEDNVNQQGRLPPQGFTNVKNNPVRPRQTGIVIPNGATVTRYFYDLDDLHYKYTYELSDGTLKSEEGAYKDVLDEDGNIVKVLVVAGGYSYNIDGEQYWTKYEADENGYRPTTGKGVGGLKPGEDAEIDPNLLKSLVG